MNQKINSLINLRKVALFSGLSTGELGCVAAFLKEKSFAKGEILHLTDDECEHMIIVRAGRVKIFRSAPSGREQIIEVLDPGDTCACNPGSTTWQCGSSAQALTDCRVWMLHQRHYVRLVQNNLNISRALNQVFAKKICQFCSFAEDMSLSNSKKKLVKFLIDMYKQLNSKEKKSDRFILPFTREEIAHRIGTTRETVTRHLSQLKRQKVIDVKSKHVNIRKIEKLRKFLSDA